MNKVFRLEGLDCANCARELEEMLEKLEGVTEVSLDFMTQKLHFTCNSEQTAEEVKRVCNSFEDVRVADDGNGGQKQEHSRTCGCGQKQEHSQTCGCGQKHEHAQGDGCGHKHEHSHDCECGYKHGHGKDHTAASSEVVAAEGMKKFELQLENIDCAACAAELEEQIAAIKGTAEVSLDFISQRLRFECADGTVVDEVKRTCNSFEEVRVAGEVKKSGNGGEKLKIEGLDCANCARELEEILNKLDGVTAAVDFVNMSVTLSAESASAREKAIYEINHFEDVKLVEEQPSKPPKKSLFREHLREIIQVIVSAVFFVPAIALYLAGGQTGVYVSYPLFAISFFSVGWEVIVNTGRNIAKGRIFDENFLMTLASVAAIVLGIVSGEGLYEGVAVMFLYQLGELLQSVAVGSSRNSIAELMNLKSDTATLLKDGEQVVVKPEELYEGDIILIKAGEKVPVDGVIVKGETALDMRSLNGESLPVQAVVGQEILSGAVNLTGAIEVQVLRKYTDSAVAKILDLVENSTAKKAKPEKFISKFAKYYTPAVCAAALVVAAIVPTIICAVAGVFTWDTYADWISRALSFLVISCPCALVISVPLSYFGGIGRCAKFGILVKGATSLDSLSSCTVAAFDKTGTITEGSFAIISSDSAEAEQLAAAAEQFSTHPIAAAFRDVETPYRVTAAEEIAGRGVKCVADGMQVLCGNARLLRDNGVEFVEKHSEYTLIHVAADGRYLGCVEIGDSVKADAKAALAELKAQGVQKLVMLTGDNSARAEAVAKQVGLDAFEAGLLPDGKLECAQKLREEGKLIYVGDGINDAPVMAAADCSVSMGKVGSDAAIEASDIVLVTDNLLLLPKARRISRGTRSIVFQNIIGSLVVKFAVMVLGVAIASFPLILAVVADVGVMLVAVLNSMRTKLIK